MNAKLFKELMDSIEEGAKIRSGELKPSRSFKMMEHPNVEVSAPFKVTVFNRFNKDDQFRKEVIQETGLKVKSSTGDCMTLRYMVMEMLFGEPHSSMMFHHGKRRCFVLPNGKKNSMYIMVKRINKGLK